MLALFKLDKAGADLTQLRDVAALSKVTSVGGTPGPATRLSGMTVLPQEARLARLAQFGIPAELVKAGERFETQLAQALHAQGWSLTGKESAKGNEWAFDATRDEFTTRIAKLYLRKSGTLTVVLGRAPTARRPTTTCSTPHQISQLLTTGPSPPTPAACTTHSTTFAPKTTSRPW